MEAFMVHSPLTHDLAVEIVRVKAQPMTQESWLYEQWLLDRRSDLMRGFVVEVTRCRRCARFCDALRGGLLCTPCDVLEWGAERLRNAA